MCVCIWWYILQNYNNIFKTSLYTTFRMYPSGPWLLKILMFALLMTGEIATYSWPWEKIEDSKYMLGLLLILISKSWGCPPCQSCLSSTATHAKRGDYLFLPGFSSLYDAIHGWMTGWMDGWWDEWMDGKLHEKLPRRPLLCAIQNLEPARSRSRYQVTGPRS